MANELEILIEEQAREMARGPRQSREEFVVLSLDQLGFEFVPGHVDARRYEGCAIHGKTFMKQAARGNTYCAECHRQTARESARRIRAARAKERG